MADAQGLASQTEFQSIPWPGLYPVDPGQGASQVQPGPSAPIVHQQQEAHQAELRLEANQVQRELSADPLQKSPPPGEPMFTRAAKVYFRHIRDSITEVIANPDYIEPQKSSKRNWDRLNPQGNLLPPHYRAPAGQAESLEPTQEPLPAESISEERQKLQEQTRRLSQQASWRFQLKSVQQPPYQGPPAIDSNDESMFISVPAMRGYLPWTSQHLGTTQYLKTVFANPDYKGLKKGNQNVRLSSGQLDRGETPRTPSV